MAPPVLDRLRDRLGAELLESHAHLGNETVVVAPTSLLALAEHLRADSELRFDMPIDCTAVDYMGRRPLRFEVVWHLRSLPLRHRLRVKVRVPEEAPVVPSLTPLWPGMNWHEREAYDLYGIRFTGHPNLRRILMYEEFVGHPLRKDYPIDRRQPLVPMRRVQSVPTQRAPVREMLNRP